MSILEDEVWVSINQRNISYYKSIGYNVKLHNNALIKVEHLLKNSRVEVTKICDNPKCDIEGGRYVENQAYQTVMKARKNNKLGYDLCKNCGKKFSWERRKNNLPYEKSLEYWAKQNNKEYLLDEFSIKNEKKPRDISFSTLDEYLWDCPKCNSEYIATASLRTNMNSACPYCHGKAINHTNCLWTTHPEMAKMLKNKDDGYKYSKGTHTKVDWICSDCNNIIENKSINNIITRGLSCPKCSDGYRYPEKFLFNVLDQLKVDFEYQQTFDWSQNKKYDFYIPSFNCILETHGEQHYRYTGFSRTLEEEQENDRLKERLAKDNGIEHYIVIDCRYSEMEWIKINILNSKLNNLLNLSNIDWIGCNIFATSSFVKTTCELFNDGYSVSEIMGKLKLSRPPILKYLKQGTKLGWCYYDVEKVRIDNGKNNGRKRGKSIVRLSLNGEFIDEFKSAKDAERKINIPNSYISANCTGKRNSTNGYRFMFKEEYIKLQNKELIHI